MRKYLKPAMEMEAFDLRDVLTASEPAPDPELDPEDEPYNGNSSIIVEFN